MRLSFWMVGSSPHSPYSPACSPLRTAHFVLKRMRDAFIGFVILSAELPVSRRVQRRVKIVIRVKHRIARRAVADLQEHGIYRLELTRQWPLPVPALKPMHMPDPSSNSLSTVMSVAAPDST